MPKILAERRDKRVMLRLSGDEYEKLKRICVATDKRSLSELVREAIDQWLQIESSHYSEDWQARLVNLESRVDSMKNEIQEIAKGPRQTSQGQGKLLR